MDAEKVTEIIKILSKISYIPEKEIHAETDIFEDLAIDSLGIIELFVAIDRKFSTNLNPNLFTRDDMRTPNKILTFIYKSP